MFITRPSNAILTMQKELRSMSVLTQDVESMSTSILITTLWYQSYPKLRALGISRWTMRQATYNLTQFSRAVSIGNINTNKLSNILSYIMLLISHLAQYGNCQNNSMKLPTTRCTCKRPHDVSALRCNLKQSKDFFLSLSLQSNIICHNSRTCSK